MSFKFSRITAGMDTFGPHKTHTHTSLHKCTDNTSHSETNEGMNRQKSWRKRNKQTFLQRWKWQ